MPSHKNWNIWEASKKEDEDPFFMGLAERKLVAIASVLIMEPDLLVLDEPATGAESRKHPCASWIISPRCIGRD